MDKHTEYLVAFLISVSFRINLVIDIGSDVFIQMINNFIVNYYNDNAYIMDKVFNIVTKDKTRNIYADYILASRYGNIVEDNPKLLSKLYDDIPLKDNELIDNLANLFCNDFVNVYSQSKHILKS